MTSTFRRSATSAASLDTLSPRRTRLTLSAIYCESRLATSSLLHAAEDKFTELSHSEVPLQELQAKMGTDAGLWVWEIVRGVDYSEGARASLYAFGESQPTRL